MSTGSTSRSSLGRIESSSWISGSGTKAERARILLDEIAVKEVSGQELSVILLDGRRIARADTRRGGNVRYTATLPFPFQAQPFAYRGHVKKLGP